MYICKYLRMPVLKYGLMYVFRVNLAINIYYFTTKYSKMFLLCARIIFSVQ